jgi:hypothetical protein
MSNLSGRNEDNRALIGFAGFGGPEIALREADIRFNGEPGSASPTETPNIRR